MLSKKPRFCSWPGCDEVTNKKYCPRHERERKNKRLLKHKKAKYHGTKI